MTQGREFSVVRYLATVLILGILLGVLLFFVYLGIAMVTA